MEEDIDSDVSSYESEYMEIKDEYESSNNNNKNGNTNSGK